MTPGLALLAPQPAQAQTNETLLTSLHNSTNSSGNCEGYAAGFRTGSAAATLAEVQLATNNSGVDVEIRADTNGVPSSSVLHQMTYESTSSGVTTFTAPDSATLSANTNYWLVVPFSSPGTCDVLTSGPTYNTLHGWSGGSLRYGSGPTGQSLRFAIVGSVHSGPAHEPVGPDAGPREPQPVTPKPFCNSSGRDPSGGTECYWESYDQIPVSDPCDQPWQVRGSYRPGRGCLNRY